MKLTHLSQIEELLKRELFVVHNSLLHPTDLAHFNQGVL